MAIGYMPALIKYFTVKLSWTTYFFRQKQLSTSRNIKLVYNGSIEISYQDIDDFAVKIGNKMYQANKHYDESALSEKVLLHTRKGLKQISELSGRKDVTLISGDGTETEAIEIRPIGEHSTYKITLINGLTLRSTYNTSVMCVINGCESLVPVENIHHGDTIVIPIDPRNTIRGNDDHINLSSYMIGSRCDVLPNELLSIPKTDVATMIMLLLVGDDQKTTVKMKDDNSISLIHESSTSRAAYQLQQLLLGYYGVLAIRESNIIILEDGELAKLANKCDIIEYLCDNHKVTYDLDYSQMKSLLSLCDYEDERNSRYIRVSNVESIGRTPTYGLKLSDGATAIANGFIVNGLLE